MSTKVSQPEQPYTLHSVNGWHLIKWDVDVPLNRTLRRKRFGNRLKVVSGRNGFIPQCIYQNNKGDKIMYVFDNCTKNLVNEYAVFACR
jgi:hypothetical protein